MTDSMKSSGAYRSPVGKRRQVETFSRDGPSRTVVKTKLPRSSAPQSKNYLSWYVALNSKPSDEKISKIPQIKWKCPPKFALNTSWHVTIGEGSEETDIQKHRETTVLEVVYPDLTSIPPSPFTSPDMEGECSVDNPTPIIPMIPIEEVAAETPFDTLAYKKVQSVPENLPVSPTDPSSPLDQKVLDKSLPDMVRGLERTDLEVAVSTASTVAAVMEKKEHINTQLLIKLLTDPEMVKKLFDGNGPTLKPENGTPPASNPEMVRKLVGGNVPTLEPEYETPPASDPEMVKKLVEGNGSTLEAENGTPPPPDPKTSLPLPNPKPVSEYCKPVKKPRPLPRATPCIPLLKNLTSKPRMELVKPQMPCTARSDGEIERLVNKYLIHGIARVMPEGPLNPSTSIPNMEAIKKMIREYGAPAATHTDKTMNGYGVDRGQGTPFVGPSPLLLASTPLPSVTNHALGFNFTAPGNFHSPLLSPVTTPNVRLNYHTPLIEQHGVMRVQGFKNRQDSKTKANVMNPILKKPCIYYSSSKGCRNGYNCPYQHDVSKQGVTGAMHFPVVKRMKFTE